jgi:hypothetical protein
LVGVWVVLNLLLANPATGARMVNWAIGTFGDKSATVQTDYRKHSFSDTFVLRTLDWPETIEASEIDINCDLFGWLPGRVWANGIRIRDGEILLWATEDKDNPEYLKSRCLAANIAFESGQATLQPAIIENEDSLVAASGRINLKTEAINVEVCARPHDVSIGMMSGDIRLGGTLRDPSFEALNEETLLQAGIAGLLSTVTGALGLLPFIQTGGEPDAPCATLLADAKETNTRNNPAANVDPKKEKS